MQINNVKQNTTKTNYPQQFTGINIGRKIPDDIVDIIANCENLNAVSKKFEISFNSFKKYGFSDHSFLSFTIQRLRPTPKSLLGRLFMPKTIGKLYEDCIMCESNPYAEIRQLTVSRIENIIADKNYKNKLQREVDTSRRDSLRKIAQM